MTASALLVMWGVKVLPFISEVMVKMMIDTILFFISYKIQRNFIF